MKTNPIIPSLVSACVFLMLAAGLSAAVEAGPKGGRLLDAAPLKAEFVVNADRSAEIVFYDEALKAAAPGTQVVAVIAEAPAGRTTLDMTATPTGFRSTQPLPDGEPYRVVVQVRAAAGEKPQNFRIDLNLADCAECSQAEYACTCEGH